MNDRELLQLAAKAAGYKVRWHSESHYGPTMEIMEDEAGGPPWNPLNDDGDAFRLAVKLKMSMVLESFGFLGPTTWVRAPGTQQTEYHEQDPCAATRRAIVRAAAGSIKAKGEA